MPNINSKSPIICFWPGREYQYARTRVLIKSMRLAGLTVLDCSSTNKGRLRYLISFLKFRKYAYKSDVILIGFLGHFLVPVAKLLTRKPLIFDSFVSIHLTMIHDRKKIKSNSFLSKLAEWIDTLSCNLADHVFAGTYEEIKYLNRNGTIPDNKFSRLFVGADTDLLSPDKNSVQPQRKTFSVEFHGEFQPLHGVKYIVQAAKLLPDIHFQLVGRGAELQTCMDIVSQHKLTNVKFLGKIPHKQVADLIAQSDLCLGIFGNTPKTSIVIPHKVYEALASGKPVITANTNAAKELLTHNKNAYLCRANDPESLANAIRTLFNDPVLRKSIAKQGRKTFLEKCSFEILGREIRSQIENLK